MVRAPTSPITIDVIDDQIAGGFRFLRFQPALENLYENDTAQQRVRILVGSGFLAIILYDFFLVSDWQMISDVFLQACIARLAIFTPLGLISIYVAAHTKSASLREGVSSGIGILSVIIIMSLFSQSKSPEHMTYHYGSVLIMCFATCVQRLRFRYAVFAVLGMISAQIAGMAYSDAIGVRSFISDTVFFITSGLLLVLAAYSLEQENRRGYLLALRGRLLAEYLEMSAKIDPLTGLWNRRHLDVVMKATWRDAASASAPMTVILLDIDYFKTFNDSYGHLEGDLCLQRVGDVLKRGVGRADVATRFGGEEFLVFLPGVGERDGQAMAERLCRGLRDEAIPHPILGAQAIVTASLGVATGIAPSTTPAALIAAADKALYAAKDGGRDRVHFAVALSGEDIDPLRRVPSSSMMTSSAA